MKFPTVFLCLPLLCCGMIACTEEPGKISVQNEIHGAVLKDVRWGDAFVTSVLLPGETSPDAVVHDVESGYGVDLPAGNPIRFYMEVQGDRIYLQTREIYNLDVDTDVEVVLHDSTPVFNPLLE